MPSRNYEPKKTTTIVASKMLMDRVDRHVKSREDTQTDFITRALVNQLENEGDFEIRELLEKERDEDEL